MWEFTPFSERALLRRVVRRETVRLVALTAIAIAVFLATRGLAARAHAVALEDAAAWYQRGQEALARDQPQQAAIAFRRATMKQRGEPRYTLGLAEALARSGNLDAATRALLNLREFTPEDSDVNLALARLAQARGDLGEAVRYYHHAIYAPTSDPERARAIRLDLIRMLIAAGDDDRAVSELIATTVDLPADTAARLEIADLFRAAGDQTRALEIYERVLSDDPGREAALEGAVRAAFELGDYRRITRYQLPSTTAEEVRWLADVSREVLARDPLASRLSAAERLRRLARNVSYLDQRWTACHLDPKSPAGTAYATRIRELRAIARRSAVGRDSERLEAAVAEIDRLDRELEQRCQDGTPIDTALQIIARLHGVTQP